MATLTVELPEQAKAFVEARVRSGEFSNPDEVGSPGTELEFAL